MALRGNELDAWDRDHFFHPSTHMAGHARGETPNRIITGGEGVYIVDRDGKRSLDAFAGLYCVNVGYGRREIADAIAAQAQQLSYYHAYVGHGSEPSIRLAKMIIDRAPTGMSRVFFGLGGSDANETNVKLVWYINNILGRPEKKKIISRWRGYHGSGIMSGSLTGLEVFHNAFDLPLPQVLHTEAPYYYRREDRSLSEEQFSQHCADKLEEMILAEGPETVAAFFAEPVMGTGGVVVPPATYFAKIQEVLRRHDVLLVVDEVITGFGRTGAWWGTQSLDIKPDMITCAKALTAAYMPLSALLVSDRVYAAMREQSAKIGVFGHGYTYGAHPVACAVALEALRIYEEDGLIDHAARVGARLGDGLRRLRGHPLVGEVRGIGLMWGVELVRSKRTREAFPPDQKMPADVQQRAYENGLVIRALGDAVVFAPPLIIDDAQVDAMLDRFQAALDGSLTAYLARGGELDIAA